jgi:hypothetical protein
MSKVTYVPIPGPYEVLDHSWNEASVYSPSEQKTVCRLRISEEDATEENQDELKDEQMATANLLSAAHDLLDACERAKDYLYTKYPREADIFNQLNRAIQKAKPNG